MIALSTGSLYSYGTARVFEMAAEAGYDGMEVLVDHRWDGRQPAYLRRLVSDYGLPIVAVHSPFVVDVPGWPADQLGRLRRTVALAQELGASMVVTHLPFRLHAIAGYWHAYRPRRFFLPVPLPRREPYVHFLHDGLAEFEAETGVTIGVENMPSKRFLGLRINGHWFNNPVALASLPHLTLDTTHLGTWGLDPLVVYERLRERVVHVHLSNYDGREHRSPPNGRLPLAEFLQRLARDGYQGVVTVETGPDALDAGDEARCRAALRRALVFCREHFQWRNQVFSENLVSDLEKDTANARHLP
jgi:sugar phosphate isomerase/epimerase